MQCRFSCDDHKDGAERELARRGLADAKLLVVMLPGASSKFGSFPSSF